MKMNLQDNQEWKKAIVERGLTIEQLEYGKKKIHKNIQQMNEKIKWHKKEIENLYFYIVGKTYSESMNRHAKLLREEIGLEIIKIEDNKRKQWQRIYFIEELITKIN